MDTLDFFIKKGPGKYTSLDKEYQRILMSVMTSNDEKRKERWEIYNMIMGELLKIDATNEFDEIKYRITDGEEPNGLFMSTIKKFKTKSSLLNSLQRVIGDFIYEDKFSRFYE